MTIRRRDNAVFDPRLTLTPPAPQPWTARAACAGMPTELFVPDGDNQAPDRSTKAICDGCPVRNDCLEAALDDPSLLGMWGGTTHRERRDMRRQQGRRLPGLHDPRYLVPCGTDSARRRHARRGETCTHCNIKETA